jgi:hypothetical protein
MEGQTVPLQWPNGRTDSTATMAKWKDRYTFPLQWPNGRTDIQYCYNGQMEGQTYSTATMAKWKKGQIGKIMI